MAVSSFEDGVQKHQKVYSFLKRTLSQEHYEGVRVIEPCVIVTHGFNRTFQFAVLGSEILYITENPPRTAKDIKITVDLACVTSVELVSFCFKQVVHNFNMLQPRSISTRSLILTRAFVIHLHTYRLCCLVGKFHFYAWEFFL